MRSAARVRRVLATAAAIGMACSFLAGCATGANREFVRVVRSAPPSATVEGLAPQLSEADGRAGLVGNGPSAFTAPNLVTFAAAREAYWNYDTAEAVRLLQKLKDDEGISEDHFRFLVLQCHEQSDRWAETLPIHAGFADQEEWRGWREYAARRAQLPAKEIEFAPGAPAVPFKLRGGDLVIAEVRVTGVKARVMVDTGANLSWWSKGFARRAGLQSLDQTVDLHDAHEKSRKTDLVLLRELQIGGMTARNVPALSGSSFWLWLFLRVDGIVGWDLLQHANLVLDFPARRMTVSAPAGPLVERPSLAGRVAPILTVLSPEGQPLQLFLDTGASGSKGVVALFANEGVLGTKTALARFRSSWRPTISLGLHSLRITWPRRTKTFPFWLDGTRFEGRGASVSEDVSRQERMVYLDGLIGNAPFLGGALTLCGVRRLVTFQPQNARTTDGAAAIDRAP